MKYRMYVDEAGNSDMKSSDNPLHRFLSLTGVIIDLDYVRTVLNPQMEALKVRYFNSHPDEPIILHRKELVKKKYPFQALRDEEINKKFDKELLSCLKNWEYAAITVCIDKKSYKDTYEVWRHDPYHYCLSLLLERCTMFLEQKQALGDVMAESRGGREDKRLKIAFSNLFENGTEYIAPERFNKALTSKQLKVKPKSKNISGLQLADLIAHPSRNEILYENDLLENGLAPFARKIIEILQEKYYQRRSRIFGKKFIQA